MLDLTIKTKKKKILSAFKAKFKSNSVTTKEIHSSFPEQILWITKQIAVNYNFKCVWNISSSVFLKKADGEMGTQISSLSQFKSIDSKRVVNC